MMTYPENRNFNLPNLISLIRILVAPALLYFALAQQPDWYLAAIVFAVFTDILDGFLARHFNQITPVGSQLDSVGDFLIYSTMAICTWILWPETVLREKQSFILIVASFTLPVIVSLIKFHTISSYHTWSVKLAVALTITGYVLLFSAQITWILDIAILFCLYAATEEIMISLLLPQKRVDVRTVWQALKYLKCNKNNIDHGK